MTSPSLLDRLERRFGHLAIPGLLRVIASFQVICFVLLYQKPQFIEVLTLTPEAWQNWEVWRFFTFTFIPGTTSLIFIIFVVMILFLIGDLLEAEWGKFRLNLFYFSSVACLWLAVWLSGPFFGSVVGMLANSILSSSLFFAFATVAPRYVLRLYGILPVEARWLALLDAAWLAYVYFISPVKLVPLEWRPLSLLGFLPFALFAVPIAIRHLRHGARVSVRRSVYKSNSLPTAESFHVCKICGRTEVSDPGLEFRISGDDEEYCTDHLP